MLLLHFHADGASRAFQSTHPAAFTVAVINDRFMTVNNRFRAIYPADLTFIAYIFVNDRTVSSPGTGFTAGSLHWPGNRPVRFGY